jgi:cytochrome P450
MTSFVDLPDTVELTRYADVAAGLKDERLVQWDPFHLLRVSHQSAAMSDPVARLREKQIVIFESSLNAKNPPDHARLRRIYGRAFSASRAEGLRSRIQAIADELIDAVQAAGEMDLMSDFALRLPIMVIAELLDIPRQDFRQLTRWSMDLRSAINQDPTPAQSERGLIGFWALADYFRKRRAGRQQELSAIPIGSLDVNADAADLSEDERIANTVLLFVASEELPWYFIVGSVLALLDHRAERHQLLENPQILPTALEELARFVSPGPYLKRRAREGMILGDTRIRKDQTVRLSLVAANHDPVQFHAPERMDLLRAPNPHLAFGSGVHYCLGAHLGRVETEIAIMTLFSRLPNLALHRESASAAARVPLQAMRSLPVLF